MRPEEKAAWCWFAVMVYPFLNALPECFMSAQFPLLMINLNRENTGHCNREDYKYGLAFLHGPARHARKKNT